MNSRDLHYLWVGKPTKTDPNGIAGHDVAGPIQMARELARQGKTAENPIKFWCLEEHAEAYRKQFADAGVKIEVRTIEDVIEKEEQGEFKKDAEFVKGRLDLAKSPDVVKRVEFKDMFSLFLMVTQGGYFLDTNVMPIEGSQLSLDGRQTPFTGMSPDGLNDFYLMYAPKRGDQKMKEVFDSWIASPGIGNVMAFVGKGIEAFNEVDRDKMGIVKASYKSYYEGRLKGLFFWFEHQQLAERIPYGDINAQIKFPGLKLLGGKCGLYNKDTEPTPADLPADVDQGFFAVTKTVMIDPVREDLPPAVQAVMRGYAKPVETKVLQIFYVNKLSNTVTCISEEDYLKSPINVLFNFKNPKVASLAEIDRILAASSDKSIFPLLKNLGGYTLLHHAVLRNDPAAVKLLLRAGANRDLKAEFEIRPEDKIVALTPQELAVYLGHPEISALFSAVEAKRPEPTKRWEAPPLRATVPLQGKLDELNQGLFLQFIDKTKNTLDRLLQHNYLLTAEEETALKEGQQKVIKAKAGFQQSSGSLSSIRSQERELFGVSKLIKEIEKKVKERTEMPSQLAAEKSTPYFYDDMDTKRLIPNTKDAYEIEKANIKQAVAILNKAVHWHQRNPGKKIGIFYSANHSQTEAIQTAIDAKNIEAIAAKFARSGNQGAVMKHIIQLIRGPANLPAEDAVRFKHKYGPALKKLKRYNELLGHFQILPVSTCMLPGGKGKVPGQILQKNLEHIIQFAIDQNVVLGWNRYADGSFPIGGSIAGNVFSGLDNRYVQFHLKLLADGKAISLPIVSFEDFVRQELTKLTASILDPNFVRFVKEVDAFRKSSHSNPEAVTKAENLLADIMAVKDSGDTPVKHFAKYQKEFYEEVKNPKISVKDIRERKNMEARPRPVAKQKEKEKEEKGFVSAFLGLFLPNDEKPQEEKKEVKEKREVKEKKESPRERPRH